MTSVSAGSCRRAPPGPTTQCRVELDYRHLPAGRLWRNGLLLLYIDRFRGDLPTDRSSGRLQGIAGAFFGAFVGIKIGNKNPKTGNCYACPLLSHATAQFSPGSTMILHARNCFVIMNEGGPVLNLRGIIDRRMPGRFWMGQSKLVLRPRGFKYGTRETRSSRVASGQLRG